MEAVLLTVTGVNGNQFELKMDCFGTHGIVKGDRGGTVVKAPCYKLEGRWFDSRWCHWNFSLT